MSKHAPERSTDDAELQALRVFFRQVAKAAGDLEGLPDGHAFEIVWVCDEDVEFTNGFITAGMIRRARAATNGIDALSEAYGKVNALGGSCDTGNEFDKGINYAVDKALTILEEFGAVDPIRLAGLKGEAAV